MISRAIATFFGGFAILNFLGGLLAPGFDANFWWIDLSHWALGNAVLIVSAIALLIYAIRPPRSLGWRVAVFIPIALLATVALADAVQFYRLLFHHVITTSAPIPFSALVCAAMAAIAARVLAPASRKTDTCRDRRRFAAAFVAAIVIFPLAQMYFFGNTDYRRKADVIVTFGARAHSDGSPSDALADRVRTACELYHDGCASLLIFSGGPGDGAIDEPQCMRALAMKYGVPESAIILDHDGLNTDATVRNTVAIFRSSHLTRVLAVSHSYHLPRIKMSYRQAGWEVYTVPATEHSRLRKGPFLVAREMVALWAYYLHPLWK